MLKIQHYLINILVILQSIYLTTGISWMVSRYGEINSPKGSKISIINKKYKINKVVSRISRKIRVNPDIK